MQTSSAHCGNGDKQAQVDKETSSEEARVCHAVNNKDLLRRLVSFIGVEPMLRCWTDENSVPHRLEKLCEIEM